MYRKKMMVIATVFIATLLAVIVWSSNIVAEHDRKMNGNKVSQEAGSEIMEGDFGKEEFIINKEYRYKFFKENSYDWKNCNGYS